MGEGEYSALLTTIYGNGEDLLDAVGSLLDEGADPSYLTEYGESPLRVASNNGRFDVVARLLGAGADESQLGWMPLFHEIAFGTVESLQDQLARGVNLAARDFWERTPWLFAVHLGDVEKAELLLAAGSDPEARGRCGRRAMAYPVQKGQVEMLRWLIVIGFDVNDTDKFGDTPLLVAASEGNTECVQTLLDAGADVRKENHIPEKPINVASNLAIVKLLLEAGEDLNDVCPIMRRHLLGLPLEPYPLVPEEQFHEGKRSRFGRANPERVDIPFWNAMVRSTAEAYRARERFGFRTLHDPEPVWCYRRFGKSITDLGDGRYIEIAGEHEDHYDPDFYIYNDVFLHKGNGAFEIYIYPEDVFPPTDFHTATLVDGKIYIIGSLGYRSTRRPGDTPVYRLDVATMRIEKLETTGDHPGWIHEHRATYMDGTGITVTGGKLCVLEDGKQALVENTRAYKLSLDSLEWTRVE